VDTSCLDTLSWSRGKLRTLTVRRWFDLAPAIGNDLFLKLYTHGAQERNLEPLLGGALGNMFRRLKEEADRRGIEIHWATAYGMFRAIDDLIRT